MVETTIRIKDVTYTKLIQARGSFEQTFGVKLTLDDTVYIQSLYTNSIFGILRKLVGEGLIRIKEDENGRISIEIDNAKKVLDRLAPETVESFKEVRSKLEERDLKLPIVTTGAVG